MKKFGIGCLVIAVLLILLAMGRTSGTLADSTSTSNGRADASESGDPGAATRIEITPDMGILNFRTGRMTIVAMVPPNALDSKDMGFVWAYSTNPGFIADGSWSDMPIRMQVRAGELERVRAVRKAFEWWNNSSVLDTKYRVRVFVGPDSALLYQRSAFRDKDERKTVAVRTVKRLLQWTSEL